MSEPGKEPGVAGAGAGAGLPGREPGRDPKREPVTVCVRCRAVAVGVWPQCVECGAGPGSEEYYETRVEGEARAAGLWFERLRLERVPERAEDGMARVDYTDPYFKEGR